LLSNAALVAKATSSFFIIRYCLTTAGLGEISSPTAVVGLDAPRLVAASIRPFADLGRGPFRVRKFTICAIAAHLCHFILLGINDGGGHEWALGKPQWRSPNQTRQAALECAWDGDTIMVHSMATDVAPRAPTHTSDVPVSRELAAILQLRACRSTAERP